MKTRLVRFAYAHRALLKRFLPVRGPVLLRLDGFKMYVRLDDWAVGARIALKRAYEPHVIASLRPLLKPDTVMLDIGANIGYYTLFAAARLDRGKLIAFEPGSDNCALLRMSLEANGFDHVTLHPYAVADRAGVVGFGLDDSNGRISRDDPSASPCQVQAIGLDTFLPDEPRIDVIKMDIEGAEDLALRGMSRLVRRHRPAIFTEFNPRGLQTASAVEPTVYLDRLRDLGYDLLLIPTDGGPPEPRDNDGIMACFARRGQADHVDLLADPYPHNLHIVS